MRVSIPNLPNTVSKEHFPNICQSDTTIPVLAANPKTHCGPVAVSNLILHLAKTQHQMLVQPMGDLTKEQYLNQLIELLASSNYMNTGTLNDSDPGTTPQHLIDGLERYVTDRGYSFSYKSWNGWGAGEVTNPSEAPPVNSFAEGVYGDRNSIFHLGWYLDPLSGIYTRTGGHFANHVGFSDLNTGEDFQVSIHDPSPRSECQTKFCFPEELVSGKLDNKGKREPSGGYFALNGVNVNPNKSATLAIVDGMFTLEVKIK